MNSSLLFADLSKVIEKYNMRVDIFSIEEYKKTGQIKIRLIANCLPEIKKPDSKIHKIFRKIYEKLQKWSDYFGEI